MIVLNQSVNIYQVYMQHYERTGKFHFECLWQCQLTILCIVIAS